MSYSRPLYLTSPQMYGDDVIEVQTRLSNLGYNPGSIDGYFGPNTESAIIAFQGNNGLTQDGSCGPATWNKLFSSSAIGNNSSNGYTRPLYLTSPQMYGDDVRKMQQQLTDYGYNPGTVDGYFGQNSKNAVISFQRANGLSTDGSCGPSTWNKLFSSDTLNIVKDVTQNLKDLMIRYEYMFSPELNGYDMSAAKLLTFYNLVDNNSIVDLKTKGWNDSYYLFNGTVYRHDAPGNILYGYLGKVFKIEDEFLLTAAGIVNAKDYIKRNKKLPPKEWIVKYYGDDPYDAMCIKTGIAFFNTYHK